MTILLALLACYAPTTSLGPDDPVDTGTATASSTATATATTTDTGDTGGDTAAQAPVYDGGTGPWTVDVSTSRVDGQDVTWYVPDSPDVPGPLPVLVWAHGFLRGPAQHAGAAARAASWGFLVAVPELRSSAFDPSVNAANGPWIAGTLLPEARRLAGSDSVPVGLVGHSAGGFATLVAASLVQVDAWVGLDAVDDFDGTGATLDESVMAPALLIRAPRASCNADGNSGTWRTGGVRWTVTVEDSNHCDFESDTDSTCELFCGGAADPLRQELVQAYAIGWLVHHLQGGAEDWVEGGARAQSDRDAGRLRW
jgi:acetyl esterase/lipase